MAPSPARAVPDYLNPDLDLLTPAEAAEVLKLPGARTLERWRTDGCGPPFVRIGRRVAYRRGDLAKWVARQVRRSTSEEV